MSKKNSIKPNITEHKLKVKLTIHPNEWKYCGRMNSEYRVSQIKYFSSLNEKETNSLLNKEEIFHESKVKEFFNSLKENDFIGIGCFLYTIKEINENGFVGITNKSKEVNVSIKDIDMNIGFDFAEILKRDGELYNTNKTREVTLKIIEQKNAKSKQKPVHKFSC